MRVVGRGAGVTLAPPERASERAGEAVSFFAFIFERGFFLPPPVSFDGVTSPPATAVRAAAATAPLWIQEVARGTMCCLPHHHHQAPSAKHASVTVDRHSLLLPPPPLESPCGPFEDVILAKNHRRSGERFAPVGRARRASGALLSVVGEWSGKKEKKVEK